MVENHKDAISYVPCVKAKNYQVGRTELERSKLQFKVSFDLRGYPIFRMFE